jgi:hypothetical protein
MAYQLAAGVSDAALVVSADGVRAAGGLLHRQAACGLGLVRSGVDICEGREMTDLTKTEIAIIVALTPIACLTYPFRWLAWACKSKYRKGSAPGLWAVLLVCLLAGCSTTGNPTPEPDPVLPMPVLTGTVERAGLFTGILSTGKYYSYGYESLYCPGADVDMWDCKAMAAESRPYFVTNAITLLSQQASWLSWREAYTKQTAGMGPEDLLVLSISSHGGREKDKNGDEPDGYDSTICMYDRPVLDDEFWDFITSGPPIRIFAFSMDSCYSESNLRALWPFGTKRRPFGFNKVQKLARAKQWGGSIVLLSACRKDESALGSAKGGQFTYALRTVFPAPTVQKWFDWAASEVTDQTPKVWKYGPLADSMLAGEPFK